MAYETLAGSYDRLTSDVDYGSWLDYYDRLLALYGKAPRTVLDLACGTGSLAILLARRGLQVLGADASEQMLTEAAAKAADLQHPPFFIRQKMQNLRLPQPVELVICSLDALNYLTEPADCRKTLERVWKNLTPGGLFFFDVNSEQKLRDLDGQIFLDEDENVYCVWRAAFDSQTRICTYGMDLFERKGRSWRRSAEQHEEYAYTEQELTQWLEQAGFCKIRCFGDRSLEPPAAGEQRLFFAAQRPETAAAKGETKV